MLHSHRVPRTAMGGVDNKNTVLTFGPFELNLRSGELRKHGIKIQLHHQPYRVLFMLASRPGEVVLREEIQRELWPDGTVVEFDHGINATMQRIRVALGDSAENPRYIETLPKRGYRFLANVTAIDMGTTLVAPFEPAPPPAPVPNRPIARPRRRGPSFGWRPVAAAGIVLAALGVWRVLSSPESGEPPRYERLTFRRGVIQAARFTPDAGSVIYSAAWDGEPLQIYSTQAGVPESRSLGVVAAGLLAIAPTGEMALASNCRFGRFGCIGTLSEMKLHGEGPREILEKVQFADWSRDGKRQAVSVLGPAGSRLEYPRGRILYEAKGSGWPGDPRVSPDGQLVAFADHFYFGNDGSVAIVNSNGQKRTLTPVFDTLDGLAWTPDGKEIWFTAADGPTGSQQLFAVTPAGNRRLVVRLPGNIRLQDIAADGRVVLTQVHSQNRVYLHRPADARPRDLTWLSFAIRPIPSEDGKFVVMTENDQTTMGKSVAFLRGADGSPAIRLGENSAVSVSPDGKWVATIDSVAARSNIVLLPVKSGAPITIDTSALELAGMQPNYPDIGWMPDSSRIVFAARQSGQEFRTYVQHIHETTRRPITPEGLWGSAVSPDGKFLFAIDRQQRATLVSLDGGPHQLLSFLTPEFRVIRFSASERSVYAVKPAEMRPTVWRIDLTTGRSDIWREVPINDPAGIVALGGIRVTGDGQSITFHMKRELSDLYLVSGLGRR